MRGKGSTTVALAALVLALASTGVGQERERPFRTHHGGPRLQVLGRVRTGSLPKSVTISPDGTRAVVCNFGHHGYDSLHVYDTETLERVGTATFEGNGVESVFSADGATLYVSNFFRSVVEVIDFATLEVVREIDVGQHPKGITLSPDGSTLYVANWGDRTVSVVDTASQEEVRVLRTERHPRGIAVRPDGTLLAAAFHGDVVHVFAAGARRESARWETCGFPRHLVLSPDAATTYVACTMGYVGMYETASGRLRGIGITGENPRSIARNGDGRWVAAANFASSDVTLIDTERRRHRNYEIPRASRVVGIAMHPGDEPRVFATSWDTNELVVLGRRVRPASDDDSF
jgi:YVTN family beta-propeller protein